MRTLLRIIDTLNKWVGDVICFLILPSALILTYESMVRYGFNKPTEWAYSISLFLTGAFFILGGGYALLYKSHVNMDVVYNRFPLKTRAIVDLFTSTLFFLFCGVLFWKSLGYVWNSLTILETTDYPPYFPIYPVKLTIPIAAFLILLQGLAKFIRDFMIAITGRVA